MRYLAIIKDVLASMRCPVHNEIPVLTIDEDDELQIKCCCPEFKMQCLYLIHKIGSLFADE